MFNTLQYIFQSFSEDKCFSGHKQERDRDREGDRDRKTKTERQRVYESYHGKRGNNRGEGCGDSRDRL